MHACVERSRMSNLRSKNMPKVHPAATLARKFRQPLKRIVEIVVRPVIHDSIRESSRTQSAKLFPLPQTDRVSVINSIAGGSAGPMPVPPRDLWVGYAETEDDYL